MRSSTCPFGSTEELDRGNIEQICENVALNTILQYYKEQAEEKGIDTFVLVGGPRETGFSEMDLCIMAGNLLENAFEACERQKEAQVFNVYVLLNG